jgi:hypothetical protein
MAEKKTANAKPKPSAAHKRLAALLGTWKTEGTTVASPDQPSISIRGTDAYEWLPGEFFLVHHVDVHMGDEHHRAIEMIGYDAASQSYPMHAYDNQGNATVMTGTVSKDGVWTFADDAIRATLTMGADGRSMTAFWERKEGAKWLPWMNIDFRK